MKKLNLLLIIFLIILGGCKSGFINENGELHYYENGKMKTGWVEIGPNKYYFDKESGDMLKNTQRSIGGKDYIFDNNGIRYLKPNIDITGLNKSIDAFGYRISIDKCIIDKIEKVPPHLTHGDDCYDVCLTLQFTKLGFGQARDCGLMIKWEVLEEGEFVTDSGFFDPRINITSNNKFKIQTSLRTNFKEGNNYTIKFADYKLF